MRLVVEETNVLTGWQAAVELLLAGMNEASGVVREVFLILRQATEPWQLCKPTDVFPFNDHQQSYKPYYWNKIASFVTEVNMKNGGCGSSKLIFWQLVSRVTFHHDHGGRSIAGIAGSNPAGGMDVFFVFVVCFVGRGLCDGPISRPGESCRMFVLIVWWGAIVTLYTYGVGRWKIFD